LATAFSPGKEVADVDHPVALEMILRFIRCKGM